MEYSGWVHHMLNDNALKIIEKNISELAFEDAYQAAMQVGIEKCWETLSSSICYEKPMELYVFLMYCVSRQETAFLHFCIFQLLTCLKPVLDDPYVLGYWHIKRALELEPNNINYMRWILKIFEPYPEKFSSNDELLNLANEILKACPNDEKALEIKQNYW